MTEGPQADARKALHDSISQVASIRLLAEIMIMRARDEAPSLEDDLQQLVDLTGDVQDTLVNLMQRSKINL